MDKDLKNKTLTQLQSLITKLGSKKYLAKYIFSFIHEKNACDISKISSLGKDFRNQLVEQGYYISQLKTIKIFKDPDGTVKFLFEMADKKRIETVLLFEGKRRTLCVSTQVGCAMNCSFCATAKLKLDRNLTTAEITDQVNTVFKQRYKITNIVFMGMGEPLQNYDNLIRAIEILNHPAGKNIGIRHLTVSTCGLVPQITKLANEQTNPILAVSINAPDNDIRNKIMPVNKKYPLEKLFKALQNYQYKTKQRITFEYVLIKRLNDNLKDAQLLAKKLKNIRCNINLIEFNPHPGCKLTASDTKTIETFAQYLRKAGIETTIRLKKGQKIKAACGQLGAGWLKGKQKP